MNPINNDHDLDVALEKIALLMACQPGSPEFQEMRRLLDAVRQYNSSVRQ